MRGNLHALQNNNFFFRAKKKVTAVFLSGVLAVFAWNLFMHADKMRFPYSYALYDKKNTLLAASTAADGQWRFAPSRVPEKFISCITTFEDKRFFFHAGFDVLAIYRAAFSDLKQKKIVSGASTITMQLARIFERQKKRTLFQKIKEMALAFFYELRYTKKNILSLYAANAPFGGNVVGLEAASWRYFNRESSSLTWAECAALAVLPNEPALVYPGAHKTIFRSKRNALLKKLFLRNIIDEETYKLSLLENLPEKPFPLPNYASHYFVKMKKAFPEQYRFQSSLDFQLQKKINELVSKKQKPFADKGIENAALIVLDTEKKIPLAYFGNFSDAPSYAVDIIASPRSSGSVLKPFLFAAMLDSGLLLPEQLVIDIPTRIGNYKPENNMQAYAGVVKAGDALSRSLNIPAVRELQAFGVRAFLDILKNCGFTTFTRSTDEYGLSLILGGGEITLEEASIAYARMMNRAQGKNENDFPLSAGASYLTLDALQKGVRPQDELQWEKFSHSKKIAWKTGTSSGKRDAWCIGCTKEFTVGVWVGNAKGYGNANLASSTIAAPLLFEIFSALPNAAWISPPYDDLSLATVCEDTGFEAGEYCAATKKILKPNRAPFGKRCPYCQAVSLTRDGKFRAFAQDLSGGDFPKIENRFVLPPALEYWYVRSGARYKTLPPLLPNAQNKNELAIVFPLDGSHIVIPKELSGERGNVVLQALHRDKNAIVYWDLDGEYLASTSAHHELALFFAPGKHALTLTDSRGNRASVRFFVDAEN